MGKASSRALRTAIQVGAVAAILGLLEVFTNLSKEQISAIGAALMVLAAAVMALIEESTGRTLFEPAKVQRPADVVEPGRHI